MFEYKDLEYLKEKLKTDLDKGLSSDEANRRKKLNGLNIIEGKKRDGFFKLFLSQLRDPMIYILLVAIVISAFLKEYSDAIVVLIVVILNAFIGAFQEIKTEKALEMLKNLSAHKCVVYRDGVKSEIDASELVKGDLLYLEAGNSIGADIRFVATNNLSVDESSITGESHPVRKSVDVLGSEIKSLGDKKNIGYMSTLIVSGSGLGVVISTGMETEMGRIAKVLKEEDKEPTPLQKRLFDLGKLLGIITLCVCALMFVIALLEKRNALDMFISAISLAVAAIPEGLPAVVTIVLAIGVQRMVQVNTIVKRLPSVETLGSVSVVCSDKTGTLTENKLRCVGIYQDGKFSESIVLEDRELINCMALCNNGYKQNKVNKGSPMESALLELLDQNELELEVHTRLEEKEFDSTRKMMSTLNRISNTTFQYTKGAYDKIIHKCNYIRIDGQDKILSQKQISQISAEVDKQAANARRILAFAYKVNSNNINEENMVFLGFVAFVDPPRDGVKEAVEKFKNAGVKTIMITGDYIKTAFAIGKEIGIVESEADCISGEELDGMSDGELKNIVEKNSVFARVTPLHKVRIVKALKSNDRIVAMTGDGVNDAPSLKKADIGIAMGITGSDVAKEASDIILLDDNFSTIETAIEEGRTIYNNIKKTVLFLLSSNFAEIFVMTLSIILGFPVPLLAIHILLVNLLTDSIPALALGADLKDFDVMNENPRSSDESLFARGGLLNTIIYGTIIAALTMIAFLVPGASELFELGESINFNNLKNILNDESILSKAQTYAFVVLSLTELFYSFVVRNIRKSAFRKDVMKNKYLNFAVLGGILITIAILYIPFLRNGLKLAFLAPPCTVVLITISFSVLAIHELIHRLVSRETHRRASGVKR